MIQLGNDPLNGALCKDIPREQKDWFFAEGQAGKPDIRRAKAICNSGCPVRKQCLELALSTEVNGERFGVFGGLSASERNKQFLSWHRMRGLCRKGLHDMKDPDNRIVRSDGVRCRVCKNERNSRWEMERRQEDAVAV